MAAKAPAAPKPTRRPTWAGQERVKNSTLSVKPDWKFIEEYPLTAMNKLRYEVDEPRVVYVLIHLISF
jgi:hypothetical protein